MDFEEGKKEWIATNGLGGYASSTLIGCNTRKYHGLLVASVGNERKVLLNKLDEQVVVNGLTVDLATNQYDVVAPKGHSYLSGVCQEVFPEFTYTLPLFGKGKVVIRKRITVPHGRNATLITYDIETTERITLRLLPLVSFRSIHSVGCPGPILQQDGVISCNGVQMHVAAENLRYAPSITWYRGFQYAIERDRGFPFAEDLCNPGRFEQSFLPGVHTVALAFSCQEPLSVERARQLADERFSRKRSLLPSFCTTHKMRKADALQALLIAADSFIVRREGELRIIAGYPWFDCYARDTLISLEGILLTQKRFREAKSVLRGLLDRLHDGLLPNIAEGTDPAAFPHGYHSIDAPLHLIHACKRYLDLTKDAEFLKAAHPKLASIIDYYQKGTAFGIRMGKDCLISSDEGGLTWMDAKVDGNPVTPRRKAVEIQALWYNALMAMDELTRILRKHSPYAALAKAAGQSFQKYWNGSYLDDCEGDSSIRPNMLYAVSLPYPLLTRHQQRLLIAVVDKELLTPAGLRTLSPRDPRYTGIYHGDQRSRDLAYHQGTVWPYLLGVYADASLRINGDRANRERIAKLIFGLLDRTLALHTIPEIFEAATLRPDGCSSQAWSVAEAVRALSVVARRGRPAGRLAGR